MITLSARDRRGNRDKTVRILGTHGIPAGYGGFETAAENVAYFLRDNGWRVIVYCQSEGDGPPVHDLYNGVERVTIGVGADGWLGTSTFDLKSIAHASRHRSDICLTFGYNTAIFNVAQRALGIPNVINMDGIEWSRKRWGLSRQAILYVNERIGALVGDVLIADHPEIATHLRTRAPARKIATVTYGAPTVTAASAEFPESHGLTAGKYLTLIARPIPENNILEIVEGFSRRARGLRLAVLGNFLSDDPYHRQVLAAASDEVDFLGAIYDAEHTAALRFHGCGYVHGHTVGGTNPSLVEALGAANAVIAHDNPYNRWVAQDAALYFTGVDDIDNRISQFVDDPELVSRLSVAARRRHAEEFTWEHVAGQYEKLLLPFVRPEVLASSERESQ